MAFSIFVLTAGSGAVVSNAPLRVRAIHLLAFGLAFLVPAAWIGSPTDVKRRWRPIVACILLATIAWDVATAQAARSRTFLMDWPIVYGASLLLFSALLGFHGFVVERIDARTTGRENA